MPKATKSSRLGRVARRMAAAEPLPISVGKEPSTFDEEPSTQTLSRGQRRRQAKRDQYRKREQMILSSLRLKSQEEQKGRIDGLDAIREALKTCTDDKIQILFKKYLPIFARTSDDVQVLLDILDGKMANVEFKLEVKWQVVTKVFQYGSHSDEEKWALY